MGDTYVERIIVRNFRGILELNLPLNKQNLLLVGENGSGKTSIIDAFEYLITGKVDRLEHRQDIQTKHSIPFIKKKDGHETIIKFECYSSGNSGVVFSRSYSDVNFAVDSALSKWAKQLKAYPPILRRHQIIQIIEYKGADRLQQLSQIIGLTELDNIKSVWEAEKRRQTDHLKRIKTEIEQIKGSLNHLLGDDQGSDVFDRISHYLNTIGLPSVNTIDDIRQVKQTLSDKIGSQEIIEQYQTLKNLSQSISELQDLLNKFMPIYNKEFYPNWIKFTSEKSNMQIQLLNDFLQQGQKILDNSQEDDCPFCEQPIEKTTLAVRIIERQERFRDISELSVAVDKKRTLVNQLVQECISNIESLLTTSQTLYSIDFKPIQNLKASLTGIPRL